MEGWYQEILWEIPRCGLCVTAEISSPHTDGYIPLSRFSTDMFKISFFWYRYLCSAHTLSVLPFWMVVITSYTQVFDRVRYACHNVTLIPYLERRYLFCEFLSGKLLCPNARSLSIWRGTNNLPSLVWSPGITLKLSDGHRPDTLLQGYQIWRQIRITLFNCLGWAKNGPHSRWPIHLYLALTVRAI